MLIVLNKKAKRSLPKVSIEERVTRLVDSTNTIASIDVQRSHENH